MKKSKISLAIREMQIKITIQYHPTPIRMAINTMTKITNAGNDVEKGNRYIILVGMQISTTIREQYGVSSKNVKIDLPYDLTVPFLGIYPKKTKRTYQRDTNSQFIAAFLNSQDMQST